MCWDIFNSREGFLQPVIHLTWEGLKAGGGSRSRAYQTLSLFPTRLWSAGLRAPLFLPPRQPTAEAGNADTAGFLCHWPAGPGPRYTALFVRDEAWSPLQILPQPTLLPPTKALSDQSLCWVEWRQETVIPPRLGPTLHRAAHYQAEMSSQGFSGVATPPISPEASLPASLGNPSAVIPTWSWLLLKTLAGFRPGVQPLCDPA